MIYLVVVTIISLLLLYEIGISPGTFWLDIKYKTILWVELERDWLDQDLCQAL
jgi:hypothetical protein